MSSLPFPYAHASDPDWRVATEQCLAQLAARSTGRAVASTLGFLYVTDRYSGEADAILSALRAATGVAQWTGTVGVGICATGTEYFDEPAMAVMLAELPDGAFRVFSGTRPPPQPEARTPSGAIAAHAALVHADPAAPDLPDLLLDMAGKVESGWVFGGLSSSRAQDLQFANETISGSGPYGAGISGVVFSSEVHMLARVTQGCHPLGARAGHVVTQGEGHIVERLDERPALDVLLETLALENPHDVVAHPRLGGGLFVGLAPPGDVDARIDDYLVRHVVALDPSHGSIGVAGDVQAGRRLVFCTRDAHAARQDLVRICTELRDELEREASVVATRTPAAEPLVAPEALERIRGALYVSCVGRGHSLFGQRGEELRLVREHLGDVPLVGFYANGEIARHRLYGYTGVLTLFS